MLRGLVLRCSMLSVQIEIGAPAQDFGAGVVGRAVDERDIPRSNLVLCQLRGRNLPVAAASFAENLMKALNGLDR